MKWYSCNDKSYTPPLEQDLLLANTAAHVQSVDRAHWDGENWYDPMDKDYVYRVDEVQYWARWPEYPNPSK